VPLRSSGLGPPNLGKKSGAGASIQPQGRTCCAGSRLHEANRTTTGHVAASLNGLVVHYQGCRVTKLRRSWANARTAAGLGNEVVPHVLRHTAATWLMRFGVPLWEAAGYLGMTEEVLEAIYGHHHPEHQKNVENAFTRSQAVPRNARTKVV
jgi:integrase